jgi:hypothetical protein
MASAIGFACNVEVDEQRCARRRSALAPEFLIPLVNYVRRQENEFGLAWLRCETIRFGVIHRI